MINDKLAQSGTSSLLLSRGSKESNKLHKRWRKGRFYTDVDRLLSGGEAARHDPSEASSSDSNDDTTNAERTSLTARRQNEPQHIIDATQSENFELSMFFDRSVPVLIPLDSWRLLDLYFTYTCWFPVSEKHDLMKLSYSYPAEGLTLSSNSADGGLHAELWSVLALASVHDTNDNHSRSMMPASLYATARSLIPDESGRFDLNHVKALLNLAIFNIAHASMDAAWLIVAYASRILQSLDQATLAINPRSKHAFYGCYILDSMLALHFGRHPCLRIEDINAKGAIDENGLDEWQPWVGQSRPFSGEQSRTPALALSTFNALLNIVNLSSGDDGLAQDKLQVWELSLPPKLAHVCSTASPASLSPPTILLRLTYFCTTLSLMRSQTWLLRALNLLEQAQDDLGWQSLPPVLRCLLEYLENCNANLSSSHEIRSRLSSLRIAMNTAWPPMSQPARHTATPTVRSTDAAQGTTPTPISRPAHCPLLEGNTSVTPSPFETTTSETQSQVYSTPHVEQYQNTSISHPHESQAQELPSDLESFFDELAALDNTINPDTQPQFLQNLGFAPDANMADLFSEYVPIQSSAFMGSSNAMDLNEFGFYDGS